MFLPSILFSIRIGIIAIAKGEITMYKMMSIFGTRPEAIKMAPIIHTASHDPMIKSLVCVTAQHREMLDSVLNTFSIHPDYDLNIMRHGQTLQSITSVILEQLTPVLTKECFLSSDSRCTCRSRIKNISEIFAVSRGNESADGIKGKHAPFCADPEQCTKSDKRRH